jgi:hypothetical protein
VENLIKAKIVILIAIVRQDTAMAPSKDATFSSIAVSMAE